MRRASTAIALFGSLAYSACISGANPDYDGAAEASGSTSSTASTGTTGTDGTTGAASTEGSGSTSVEMTAADSLDETDASGSSEDAESGEEPPPRVRDGLRLLYTFEASGADVVEDESEYEPPVDLSIVGTVELADGCAELEPSSWFSAGSVAPERLAQSTFTIELWVEAAGPIETLNGNVILDGPRLFSFEDHSNTETLTPNIAVMQSRTRTSVVTAFYVRGIEEGPLNLFSGNGLHQLVLVRDATGAVRGYVDGAPATALPATQGALPWEVHPLSVGAAPDAEHGWEGRMCLVAFYDRALTEVEVATNFAAGHSGQ